MSRGRWTLQLVLAFSTGMLASRHDWLWALLGLVSLGWFLWQAWFDPDQPELPYSHTTSSGVTIKSSTEEGLHTALSWWLRVAPEDPDIDPEGM